MSKNILGGKISILKFIERTKKGEYAQVDLKTLDFIRIEEETDIHDIYEDEEYYYNMK